MANRIVNPTVRENQRSEVLPNYLYRIVPQWNTPTWYDSEMWRRVVRNQPIAMICRETLISNILYLDWEVNARDTTKRQEYRSQIDYYTKIIENPGSIDYAGFVETLCQDILDIPFGGAAEIGRSPDSPSGKVYWMKNIDGATLFPTLNLDYPVVQKSPYNVSQVVSFPKHAIARSYLSPRPEITREGWGMAPPEKIYLALELLWRGDQYYANLLLDTPQAGILDLGDMEKQTAFEWVDGFRDLMNGINAFKIPVLYEHTSQVKWIPFTKPPTELMFDGITSKYASIVCAGYGMTLGDIGFTSTSNGGETLSGTIRQERKTRRTGQAVLKKKLKSFFDSVLPDYLQFNWIDYEEELNVSMGRARLSNATAFDHLIKNKIITPEEARLQLIQDGVITIPIPDKIPESELTDQISNETIAARPGTLGDPVNPSLGGHGEVTNKSLATSEIHSIFSRAFSSILENVSAGIKNSYSAIYQIVRPKIVQATKEFSVSEYKAWSNSMIRLNMKNVVPTENNDELVEKIVLEDLASMAYILSNNPWWEIEVDAEALFELYLDVYTESSIEKQKEFVLLLLSLGYTVPGNLEDFNLTNEKVLEQIRLFAYEAASTINAGTPYFISGIILSAFYDVVNTQEFMEMQNEGKSIDEIFLSSLIISSIISSIIYSLDVTLADRINTITDYETKEIDRLAVFDTLMEVGIEEKHWVTTSEDPCTEFCIPNQEVGWVDMSYIYQGAFGEILHPLAHPHCACEIEYRNDDIIQLMANGDFSLWLGE